MLRLEAFETEKPEEPSGPMVILDQIAFEEKKLEAYDKGYQAGWEDASEAQANEQSALGAELAGNLQSLSFTYQEARAHILRALRPLLAGIADKVLPAIARETLGPVIGEVLVPLAERAADQPVALVLHPARQEAVGAFLQETFGMPLVVKAEPSLGEGQAYLRMGTEETAVDLDGAVAAIQAAIRGFLEQALNEKVDHVRSS